MQSIGTELGAAKSMDGGSRLDVEDGRPTLQNFGYYKGNVVAIKWLSLDNINLHRGDLVELKWVGSNETASWSVLEKIIMCPSHAELESDSRGH